MVKKTLKSWTRPCLNTHRTWEIALPRSMLFLSLHASITCVYTRGQNITISLTQTTLLYFTRAQPHAFTTFHNILHAHKMKPLLYTLKTKYDFKCLLWEKILPLSSVPDPTSQKDTQIQQEKGQRFRLLDVWAPSDFLNMWISELRNLWNKSKSVPDQRCREFVFNQSGVLNSFPCWSCYANVLCDWAWACLSNWPTALSAILDRGIIW